jgi:lysophospholipase L1-like esterase
MRQADVEAQRALLKSPVAAHARVVLLADSMTEPFSKDEHVKSGEWLNLGVGSDTAQNVLWRVLDSWPDAFQPAVIMIAIGTNNLGDSLPGHKRGSDDATCGVKALIQVLKRLRPSAKILLQAILPQSRVASSLVERTNHELSFIATSFDTKFLDLFGGISL